MAQELVSKVWQIAGVFGGVTAGLLTYSDGQVSYLTQEGVVFNVPLAELKNIKWPFLRMGLGFDTDVKGKKYKFSLAKPNASAPDISDTMGDQLLKLVHVGRFWEAVGSFKNLKQDKATTKAWKELLNTA